MLLTSELIKKLRGKIYYTLPKGHLSPYEKLWKLIGRIKIIEGSRHENITQASTLLKNYGWPGDIEHFQCILVVIRNPYDYMVSRFFYLKDIQRHNRTGQAAKIEAKGNFKEYVLNDPDPFQPQRFLLNNAGRIPENLSIVKYESLQMDLNGIIQQYVKSPISFRRKVNNTHRKDFKEYVVDGEIESAIYNRFPFLYDQGYYKRIVL